MEINDLYSSGEVKALRIAAHPFTRSKPYFYLRVMSAFFLSLIFPRQLSPGDDFQLLWLTFHKFPSQAAPLVKTS